MKSYHLGLFLILLQKTYGHPGYYNEAQNSRRERPRENDQRNDKHYSTMEGNKQIHRTENNEAQKQEISQKSRDRDQDEASKKGNWEQLPSIRDLQKLQDHFKADESRKQYSNEKGWDAEMQQQEAQQQDDNTWRFNVNVPEILEKIKTYTGLSIKGNSFNTAGKEVARNGPPVNNPWAKVYTVEVKPDYERLLGYINNIFTGRRIPEEKGSKESSDDSDY